jgi:hypothetical protein
MKEKKSTRTRIIGLRLTINEYDQLNKKCRNSNASKLSEFVRRLLFNKPITVYHRNKSLDDFMAEMIRLRTELNAIGNNFNQAVKKLHTLQQIEEFKGWILNHESNTNELLQKTDEIKNYIKKIAEKWLQ